MKTDSYFIEAAKALVENQLGWGKGENWTNQDFHKLSELILKKTGSNLSAVTLKRIWGRITYHSTPSTTTLDILVRFVGFENWREFKINQAISSEPNAFNKEIKITGSTPTFSSFPAHKKYSFSRIALLLAFIIAFNFISVYFIGSILIPKSLDNGLLDKKAVTKEIQNVAESEKNRPQIPVPSERLRIKNPKIKSKPAWRLNTDLPGNPSRNLNTPDYIYGNSVV